MTNVIPFPTQRPTSANVVAAILIAARAKHGEVAALDMAEEMICAAAGILAYAAGIDRGNAALARAATTMIMTLT